MKKIAFLETVLVLCLASGTVYGASTVTVDFPPGTLPFPDFYNITTEYSDKGMVFSATDNDLPLEYQKSLGSQENAIGGGTFYNLFRVNFITADPVVNVSVTLGDQNGNAQTHTLTAFDSTGNVLDIDSFTEFAGYNPDTFTLTVSSRKGIAFIVAIEQPFGTERLESITYTTHKGELVVNGFTLAGNEEKWVRFVGESIVSQLLGSRSDKLRVAARASWWGLKEGTFGLSNPHRFSSCNVSPSKDKQLKPLETCDPGRAWQVGLAAVQVPNFTEQEVLDAIQALWPGRAVTEVLAEAAQLAEFDPSQDTGAAIVASVGVLRKSWLMRNPTVGLTLVERNVTDECINAAQSWCFGTRWKGTAKYSPTYEAAMQSIADLTKIFDILAP